MALQDSNMESLIQKAKEYEKKYEWLQAAKYYLKVANLLLAKKDFEKAANLREREGFCFYRAAFQAQTRMEFNDRITKSIQAYEEEIHILEEISSSKIQVKTVHARALIFYTRSLYEIDPQKKKELLIDNWWVLEHKVLDYYEKVGDFYSIGKTCNDLIEFWIYEMLWLQRDPSKVWKQIEEMKSLVEKAIKVLSKVDADYELARAFCLATGAFSWGEWWDVSPDEIVKITKKCLTYSKKAIELSKKTGDAYLVSLAYQNAGKVATDCEKDLKQAKELHKKSLEYAIITRDNYRKGNGNFIISDSLVILARSLEDPETQKEFLNQAINHAQEASKQFDVINYSVGLGLSCWREGNALADSALIEADSKVKETLLKKSIKNMKKGESHWTNYGRLSGSGSRSLSYSLRLFSEIQDGIEEKRKLLQEALHQITKYFKYGEEIGTHQLLHRSTGYYELAQVQNDLSKVAVSNSEKIGFLNNTVDALKKSLSLIAEKRKYITRGLAVGFYYGKYNSKLGEILLKIYSITRENKTLVAAIDAYKQSSIDYENAEMPTHAATSYWYLAQLFDKTGEFQEASKNYELASRKYEVASEKISQLDNFYREHSLYMKAWSQIEQARYNHSIENYSKAKEYYEKSAKLHELSELWSYLAPNYSAWARVEEAEDFSRNEQTKMAKQTFNKALEQLSIAQESIKQKKSETNARDEKEVAQKLFEASGLRQKYCEARILMENAKLLEREGSYLQSSKKYGEAAQKISAISENTDVEAERKELIYISILCRAWEKMALAEETTSSESYLEAAELFEQAKNHCYTQKGSLWALGNSNFCRGLAAGVKYQTGLDLGEHAKAKSFMKSASTHYEKAGFKAASEYARATQRLFDAYLFMNQAESESDTEKRVKQYQLTENLLQLAANSFTKAKQPEKTSQVKQILENVKEEKQLAISFNDVLQAPTIASSTSAFSAPTSSSEVSVGLESFEHANVQANLVAGLKEVKVGESFCLSVEFVNAGREPALLMQVDNFVPSDFVVVKKPEIYRLEDTTLNMKGKQLAPLKLVEVKLTLQPSKKGKYNLNPRVQYLDELGQNKTLQLKTIEIRVEEVIMEDRVSTGTEELDSLLLGGIPKEYAVVLSAPPCDERELIVENFLKAGAKEDVTFYVAIEANGLEDLLDKPNFYLFLCNPKPKVEVPDLPNVYKLQGKADITNLGIALTKAYRSIDKSIANKRVCVEILSDVLIKNGANTTREWISGLITDLGAKGFTILAVIDPSMHATEHANAVINLFDGEISILQSNDPLDCNKSILVKKLRNQEYIKNPICLR